MKAAMAVLALGLCLAVAMFARAGAALPDGVQLAPDVAYGPDPAQRLDVYWPVSKGARRPVIVMVHGGAWRIGDKRARGVADAKVAHWVPAGAVFVSIDYPMLPARPVAGQAADVAAALAYVQRHAAQWGGDPARVVLMGHSAGAHLVALLSADPSIARMQGAQPWKGTVALDSAALEVPAIMQRRHLPLYDAAFGSDPQAWERLSPRQRLTAAAIPLLAVCSSTRRDRPCVQAEGYAAQSRALGVMAAVLPLPLDHAGINRELGRPGTFTSAVDAFLAQVGAAPNGR